MTDDNLNDHDDVALILRLADGEGEALRDLARRHERDLLRTVYRYVGHAEDTRDIVQETFIAVYRHANTFDHAYRFRTWLWRIALNKCRDYSRRQRLRRTFEHVLDWSRGHLESDLNADAAFPDPSASPETRASERQTVRRLHTEIMQLPHPQRAAIVLFAVEGRSQIECAEILGVSPKTVEMRVYHARKALEKKLREFEG